MMRRAKKPEEQTVGAPGAPHLYPFTSIVGQEELKLALLLNAVEPSIGGALIMGHRGTAKSTAVRALARLLPPVARVTGCPFNCDPDDARELCANCRTRLAAEGRLPRERAPVPAVDLPLNATEDRVCGTIDLERALREGVKSFEPGLLARAHRGFLYVDEVNLLEDHLVDLLLDVAATGRNRVEREGISVEHPSRFVLVGSGNPEEGELRPQLLDRFGLCAEVRTAGDTAERMRVVMRREAFDRDPAAFCATAAEEEGRLGRRLARARRAVAAVRVPQALVRSVAELCARLNVAGHRGELTIARAARALAALEGRKVATDADARRVAPLALRHRLRRDPFSYDGGGASEIERHADELFGAPEPGAQTTAGEPNAADPETATCDGAHEGHAPGQAGVVSVGSRHSPEGIARKSSDPAQSVAKEWSEPAPAAALPFSLSGLVITPQASVALAPGAAARRSRSRGTSAARGRYFSAVASRPNSNRIAVDATLRAAALAHASSNSPSAFAPRAERGDLRYKRLSRRRGALYIFAVDTSGSMAVNRIGQAKSALAQLLRQSYVNRDEVALITFRGEGAELLMRPARASALAGRLLAALPVGGATPLAAGLRRAWETASKARRKGTEQIVLLVFTDGRANVPLGDAGDATGRAWRERVSVEIERLGAELQRARVESIVVDTRTRFGVTTEGAALARALGGRYTRLAQESASAR